MIDGKLRMLAAVVVLLGGASLASPQVSAAAPLAGCWVCVTVEIGCPLYEEDKEDLCDYWCGGGTPSTCKGEVPENVRCLPYNPDYVESWKCLGIPE